MKKFLKSLLVVGMLFALIGCGTLESQKALESRLKSIQSGKEVEEIEDQQVKVMVKLLQKMEYKILKTTEKGNESEIEVQFKVVNIAGYMPDFMRTLMPLAFSGASEEVMEAASIKFFDDLSKNKDLSFLEQNLTVYLTKENGKWEVVNNEELGNIITGNATKAFGE
ncbi:DUF5105 domain-containing protein [Fusobacterium sp. THCT1E2]